VDIEWVIDWGDGGDGRGEGGEVRWIALVLRHLEFPFLSFFHPLPSMHARLGLKPLGYLLPLLTSNFCRYLGFEQKGYAKTPALRFLQNSIEAKSSSTVLKNSTKPPPSPTTKPTHPLFQPFQKKISAHAFLIAETLRWDARIGSVGSGYIYNQVCYPRFVVVVVVVKRFTGDYNMAELFFLVS